MTEVIQVEQKMSYLPDTVADDSPHHGTGPAAPNPGAERLPYFQRRNRPA